MSGGRGRGVRQRQGARAAGLAEQIIEELGASAGYEVGLFARRPKLAPDLRERLLAVAEIIEREQGYGWHCTGDEECA